MYAAAPTAKRHTRTIVLWDCSWFTSFKAGWLFPSKIFISDPHIAESKLLVCSGESGNGKSFLYNKGWRGYSQNKVTPKHKNTTINSMVLDVGLASKIKYGQIKVLIENQYFELLWVLIYKFVSVFFNLKRGGSTITSLNVDEKPSIYRPILLYH